MKVYGISEAAKKLGVSRQSIYNRLDRIELKNHRQDTNKGKVLTVEGLEILRGLYPVRSDSQVFLLNASKLIMRHAPVTE